MPNTTSKARHSFHGVGLFAFKTMKIKEVNGEKRVYQNRKLVGSVRKFCCGIDFRPKGKNGALFSILGVKFGEKKLEKCIESLLSINIPDKDFHWNFRYSIAKNKEELKDYEKRLNDSIR